MLVIRMRVIQQIMKQTAVLVKAVEAKTELIRMIFSLGAMVRIIYTVKVGMIR